MRHTKCAQEIYWRQSAFICGWTFLPTVQGLEIILRDVFPRLKPWAIIGRLIPPSSNYGVTGRGF
jgi:hypothetical protein